MMGWENRGISSMKRNESQFFTLKAMKREGVFEPVIASREAWVEGGKKITSRDSRQKRGRKKVPLSVKGKKEGPPVITSEKRATRGEGKGLRARLRLRGGGTMFSWGGGRKRSGILF